MVRTAARPTVAMPAGDEVAVPTSPGNPSPLPPD
jgi:hypothetical protein